MYGFVLIMVAFFLSSAAFAGPKEVDHEQLSNIYDYQRASLSVGLSPETKGVVSRVITEMELNKKLVPIASEPENLSIDRFSGSNKSVAFDGEGEENDSQPENVASETIDIVLHDSLLEEKDINLMLQEAFDALIAGQAEVAVVLYRQALDVDADNTNALFGLATAYQRNGQVEQARSVYEDLLDIDPSHKEGVNNFLALMAEESPEGALSELVRLRNIDPTYSPVYAHMAVINVRLGKMDEAVQNMKQAVKLSPHNISYRYNLAVLLDRMEHWDLAADLYKQLIKASYEGAVIPGSVNQLVERLAYIRSNKIGG